MAIELFRKLKPRRWVLPLAGVVWVASCSPNFVPVDADYSPAMPISAESPSAATPENAPVKPEERPGLATGFGEEVRDEWHKQTFVRASSKPLGTDVIYYNDRKGVDAMTGYKYKVDGAQQAAGEVIEWGIKGGFRYLPSYKSGGKRFTVGTPGSSYSIFLKNRCKSRLEVVLSVDGLDVIDGKPAAFSKRGYVIAPGETLEVKGWRSGWDRVERFEFSSVGGSYANRRHGDARNVGVIGLAVFGEKGVNPWTWMPNEVRTRQTANPFATAP